MKLFIVGSPRSGTSVLASAISAVCNLQRKDGEFHLYTLYPHLLDAVKAYLSNPNIQDARAIEGQLHHRLDDAFFSEFVHSAIRIIYKQALGSTQFLDKTPGVDMISLCPEVLKTWPDAKIIFAKRRGIENVASRMRKFPNVAFENHCTQWAQSMKKWALAKTKINQYDLSRVIEIDQFHLQEEPAMAGKLLSNFLNLNNAQTLELSTYFEEQRPEATQDKQQILGLTEMGWTKEQVDTFKSICEPICTANGYSITESYFA